MAIQAVRVSGGTPAADTNEYTLFDSQTAFGTYALPQMGWKRAILTLNNSHSGTIKAYCLSLGDSAYKQYDTVAWGAPATGEINQYDTDIAGFAAVKLTWTNGGSAQTTWAPGITLIDERHTGV